MRQLWFKKKICCDIYSFQKWYLVILEWIHRYSELRYIIKIKCGSVWTDFDKCHNVSKRNVKLILKILSDLETLRGSSNKKTLYLFNSFLCKLGLFWHSGPLKRSFHSRLIMAHLWEKRPNLHKNSLNKLGLLKMFAFNKLSYLLN
jgi:hypothetical protein